MSRSRANLEHVKTSPAQGGAIVRIYVKTNTSTHSIGEEELTETDGACPGVYAHVAKKSVMGDRFEIWPIKIKLQQIME